jgi:hypothetical protein
MHCKGAYSLPYGSYIIKDVNKYEACLCKECPLATDNIWLKVMNGFPVYLLSPLPEYILPQDWKILKFFLPLQGKSDRKSLTKVYHAGGEQLKSTQDC